MFYSSSDLSKSDQPRQLLECGASTAGSDLQVSATRSAPYCGTCDPYGARFAIDPGRAEGIEPRDSGHFEATANLRGDPSRRPETIQPKEVQP